MDYAQGECSYQRAGLARRLNVGRVLVANNSPTGPVRPNVNAVRPGATLPKLAVAASAETPTAAAAVEAAAARTT
jgi:hypothetical protein